MILEATAHGVSAQHTASTAPTSDEADRKKLENAAGEFESILLASMWKSMKQSFGDPNEGDSDPASGTLNDWGIEVMSGAVGKAGGLGIGKMILKYLEHAPTSPQDHGTSEANVLANSADNTLQGGVPR